MPDRHPVGEHQPLHHTPPDDGERQSVSDIPLPVTYSSYSAARTWMAVKPMAADGVGDPLRSHPMGVASLVALGRKLLRVI
jgi:hypothetical protein